VPYFMGIDIGSRTCKGVVTRDGGGLVAYQVMPPGTNYSLSAEKLRNELLAKAGLSSDDIARTVATGNRARVAFSTEYVTDIQCSARGVRAVLPKVRTVIDVQAQTSQVIRLGETGLVSNFVVTEKCAAGSGRFLDIVANVLQVDVKDVGALSLKSTKPVTFSTGCAVFGESEAVTRVAEGNAKEDILAGVHRALASKIGALVARVGLEEPCAIIGGGALNVGLVKSIEEELGIKAMVPSHPELIAALGAAVIAEKGQTSTAGR